MEVLQGTWPCPCFMDEVITQRREAGSWSRTAGKCRGWKVAVQPHCLVPPARLHPPALSPWAPTPVSKSLPHRAGEGLGGGREAGCGAGPGGKEEGCRELGRRQVGLSSCRGFRMGEERKREVGMPGWGLWRQSCPGVTDRLWPGAKLPVGMRQSLDTEARLGWSLHRTVEASWDSRPRSVSLEECGQ